MNNNYYFENSASICCKKEALPELKKQLIGKKCADCGSDLTIVTFQEGTCVVCKNKPWDHATGYSVNCDGYRHEKHPNVIEN